jgi:predicted PurR-regulated permease PerM
MTAPPTGPPRERVPQLLVDTAGWAWRIVVIALVVIGLAKLASRLELVVVPLLTAFLLTALLNPINTRLRRARLPRSLAAITTILLALALLGSIGAFVVNRATAGYPQLVDQVSDLVAKAQHYLSNGPFHLKFNNGQSVGDKFVTFLRDREGQIAHGAISASKTAAELIGALVLTIFLTIFMLYDGDRMWSWLTNFFPENRRARIHEAGTRVWTTLSRYIVGTFTVAAFHGVVMGITLWIVGVPLVAPLAVLIFLGSFIPLVGVVIFGGLAVLVTLISEGTTAAIIVLIVLVVQNQIEGHILQPLIVGRYVRLHPMAIAVTLAAGALIAGLPGAIFGVPLVASFKTAAEVLSRPTLEVETNATSPPTAPGLQPP